MRRDDPALAPAPLRALLLLNQLRYRLSTSATLPVIEISVRILTVSRRVSTRRTHGSANLFAVSHHDTIGRGTTIITSNRFSRLMSVLVGYDPIVNGLKGIYVIVRYYLKGRDNEIKTILNFCRN